MAKHRLKLSKRLKRARTEAERQAIIANAQAAKPPKKATS